VTNIELSRTNFDIIAKNLEGSSYADYLIGFGTSVGAVSNTFALVRVGGTATLYDDAIKSLWKNYEENYGSTEGKNLVLANVRYDTDILNLLLFTKNILVSRPNPKGTLRLRNLESPDVTVVECTLTNTSLSLGVGFSTSLS